MQFPDLVSFDCKLHVNDSRVSSCSLYVSVEQSSVHYQAAVGLCVAECRAVTDAEYVQIDPFRCLCVRDIDLHRAISLLHGVQGI